MQYFLALKILSGYKYRLTIVLAFLFYFYFFIFYFLATCTYFSHTQNNDQGIVCALCSCQVSDLWMF